MLYVFAVTERGTRRLAHVNVTTNPNADWTMQQLREVVGTGGGYRYLSHDRDQIFAKHLDDSIRALRGGSVAIPSCESEGKCDLQARNRNGTTRVLGSADPDVRGASTFDSQMLGGTLQGRRSA